MCLSCELNWAEMGFLFLSALPSELTSAGLPHPIGSLSLPPRILSTIPMAGITLTSLSLTHVQFHPNDLLGEALAYVTLAPLAILVFYASVIVSRREIAGILFLAGQLSCEALNALLKEYLQIARPNGK